METCALYPYHATRPGLERTYEWINIGWRGLYEDRLYTKSIDSAFRDSIIFLYELVYENRVELVRETSVQGSYGMVCKNQNRPQKIEIGFDFCIELRMQLIDQGTERSLTSDEVSVSLINIWVVVVVVYYFCNGRDATMPIMLPKLSAIFV